MESLARPPAKPGTIFSRRIIPEYSWFIYDYIYTWFIYICIYLEIIIQENMDNFPAKITWITKNPEKKENPAKT